MFQELHNGDVEVDQRDKHSGMVKHILVGTAEYRNKYVYITYNVMPYRNWCHEKLKPSKDDGDDEGCYFLTWGWSQGR